MAQAALANQPLNPTEPGALIQNLCLETGAAGDKALLKLKAREKPEEMIREEKFKSASVHHLKLSETARAELTIAHEDNAVMSCTIHADVTDVKAAFADLQKRFKMKGVLADYLLGRPPRDVPFVAQTGGKPGRRMLGLFELQQAEGQAAGSVQAIILRDEAAMGPGAAKASPIKTGSITPAAAKAGAGKTAVPKPAAKTAAAKPSP